MSEKDFVRVVSPGIIPDCGNGRTCRLFVKIAFKDGKLSLMGVEGPLAGGDCVGGAGQIDMHYWHRKPEYNDRRYNPEHLQRISVYSAGWSEDMWQRLLEVWHDWHLNDMRAECAHMKGPEWDASKEVEVTIYSWGDEYHALRKKANEGDDMGVRLNAAQTLYHVDMAFKRLDLHGRMTGKGKCWDAEADRLLAEGYIAVEKTEKKTAGWTKPWEHPDGILCKPCPTCGHKYGSAWLHEDVPEDVLEFLRGLPETTVKPAWV